MKLLRKTFIIMLLITIPITFQSYNESLSSTTYVNINEPVKASVLISNQNISVTSLLIKNLKLIQLENPGTIEYTFFNGEGDQNIQNNQLNTMLTEKNVDLILLDMVDVKHTQYAVDRIKENNIPVLFLANVEIQPIMSYEKAYLANVNPAEGGILQGKILVDVWNNNKASIDKNTDNILQYIMLEGSPNNIFAVERTKYSIMAINQSNIKTQELATKICNWSEDEAKQAIKDLLLKFGNNIEVILANDDIMAIGAIKALQEYGFNIDNKTQNIKVVGFDGIPEAQDLIRKGIMTGTVVIDVYDGAKNYYTIGMNLLNNRNLIEGTNCTIDSSGKIITAPYSGVLVNID